MQSSPSEKVALSWWYILYRVVGGTSGSMVNLDAAAALGFPLGQQTYLVFLTWPCNVTEQQGGRQKVALRLLRLIYLELALDPRFSPLQLERSTTLHFISGSSGLNSHVCAHTMLKALSTQKWLLWLPSLKVLRVKETSCSSKESTLVKIHWQWFGTLTIMLVEMAC